MISHVIGLRSGRLAAGCALLLTIVGCAWHDEGIPPLQIAAPSLSRSVVYPHQFELTIWLANRGTRTVLSGEFAALADVGNGAERQALGAVTMPFQQVFHAGDARRVTVLFALPTAVVPTAPISLQRLRIHTAHFADGDRFENRGGAHAWTELREGEQR